MTGVANHHFFQKNLRKKFAESKKEGGALAVAMLDLDDFKMVNDSHGHQIGDEVLKNVARILRENVGKNGLIARYGGEEFVILFDEKFSRPANLKKFLDGLRRKIETEKTICGRKKIRITASFGAALLPNPKIATPKNFVAAADRAMYCAKAAGKNCCRVAEI